MSFSRENFTRTKKHKKQTSDFRSDIFYAHKKQTNDFQSDVFLYAQKSIKCIKSTKKHKKHKNVKQATFTQIFFIRTNRK